MSIKDREKWQTRYLLGAYSDRLHPSVFLSDVLANNPMSVKSDTSAPRALDLACGAGRNALFLAAQGFTVDAVDIAVAALNRGQESARQLQLNSIHWIEHDLDEGLPADSGDYDLIIMIRYLDVSLLTQAADKLRPGGYLLAEVHLQTDREVAGPSSREFRAAPGELKTAVHDLELLHYQEGIFVDPDGSEVALARLLARRPVL